MKDTDKLVAAILAVGKLSDAAYRSEQDYIAAYERFLDGTRLCGLRFQEQPNLSRVEMVPAGPDPTRYQH